MSTRSAVAVRLEDGSAKGRYVHFDGYAVGDDVRALIARDGRDKVVQTLILDNYGWSYLKADEQGPLGPLYTDGRFKIVPGYGMAYTEVKGQSSPDDWITEPDLMIEYMHVIENDGTVTTTEG